LLLAGVMVVILLRLATSPPSHPEYIVAHIVDRLPGAEGGHSKPSTVNGAGQQSTSAQAARKAAAPETPAHHLRSVRKWIQNRLASAKTTARKYQDEVRDGTRNIAKAETPAFEMKTAVRPNAGVAAIGGPSRASGHGIGTAATGTGNGGGGSGSDSEAHAAYGSAPAPEYPSEARQMEQQGLVMLRVLVSADGAAKRIELARSSGFQSLDDAALETVRDRWRFVPAMRAGAAIESWVTVPIRFALTEADVAN
jgi:protein TonB